VGEALGWNGPFPKELRHFPELKCCFACFIARNGSECDGPGLWIAVLVQAWIAEKDLALPVADLQIDPYSPQLGDG